MYKRDIYLDIDDNLDNYIKSVELDSDSRVWHFHLTVDYEPLDLTGKSVQFRAEKPDKTNVLNDCKIVDAEKGVVEVKLTRQVNAIPGHVKCLLKIIGDEGFVLKTKTFVVDVSKTLSDDAVVSSDEFDALDAALGKVQDIDNRFAQTNAQLSGVIANHLSISVKDFGAKGDGSTDDTVAIQKALDFVKNNYSSLDSSLRVSYHNVFFPKGIYKISAPLNIYNRICMIGERSIINSSADYCIGVDDMYSATIGWQSSFYSMVFIGNNGVRLNTRHGDETSQKNTDYGKIYFHDCIFKTNNDAGYSFIGDLQSCTVKFNMCQIDAPLEVLSDNFIIDSCWCNWRNYTTQEFVKFKGSKMYIDKTMFIPYKGNCNPSEEKAWLGIYDYKIPNGHQGVSFVTIDKCNFGAEASGIACINNKTKHTNSSTQCSGFKLLNSSIASASVPIARLYELPNMINIMHNRAVVTSTGCAVGVSSSFENAKLDDIFTSLSDATSWNKFTWEVKYNSFETHESTNIIRAKFHEKLRFIANFIEFQNDPEHKKMKLIDFNHKECYIQNTHIKYTDRDGGLRVKMPLSLFPTRHYNRATTNNIRKNVREFKIKVICRNSTNSTFSAYSHNITDYKCYITMATTATNQSIRIVENNKFMSNYQNSTIGDISDATVEVDYEGAVTTYPAENINGDGFGVWKSLDFKLSELTDTSYLLIEIYDVVLDSI